MLEPAQTGDAVVIISDLGENFSKTSVRDLKGFLTETGVRLFVVEPSELPASSSRLIIGEHVDPETLIALTKKSGGDHWSFYVGDFGWLSPAWLAKHHSNTEKWLMPLLGPTQHVLDEMTDFYAPKIRLPAAIQKPENWKLELVDPQTGKPDHHLVLHHPSELLPLPSGAP